MNIISKGEGVGTTARITIPVCNSKEAVTMSSVKNYIKNRFSYGDRVAVFSHHGFLEYLIPTALGVKPHIFRFSLDNVSVTVVEFCRDGNTVLRYVNK